MTDYIGLKLGNYRILRLIGRGGFAHVYQAAHIYLKTPAAIKILNMSLVNDSLESFLNEARTIALLEHPHIVRVLEFGIEGITPFLVMSYAENGTLRQRSSTKSKLPWNNAISYIKQAAEALQYAHDNGVVHCDVKPENMLLGKNQHLLLSDFGLAILAQNTLTPLPEKAGTTLYMAPEQLLGNPCRASDQYALGIVAYEYLCGSCPFTGSEREIAIQHLYSPPPSLRSKLPDLPHAIEQVVMKALAKNPQARFATVQEFAQTLAAIDVAEELLQQKEDTSTISTTAPADTVITEELQSYNPVHPTLSEKTTYKLPTYLREATHAPSLSNIPLQLPILTHELSLTDTKYSIHPSLNLSSHPSIQPLPETFTSSELHSVREPLQISLQISHTPLPQLISSATLPASKAGEAEAPLSLQIQALPRTHKKFASIKFTTFAICAGVLATLMIILGVCACLQFNNQGRISSSSRGSSANSAPIRLPATPITTRSTSSGTRQPTPALSATTTPIQQTGSTPTTTHTSSTGDTSATTPTSQNGVTPVTTPNIQAGAPPTPLPTRSGPLTVEITNAPSTAPSGSTITVVTQVNQGGVTVSLNGKARDFGQQVADSMGNATFQIVVPKQGKRMVLTASVIDADGNEVQSNSQTITIT